MHTKSKVILHVLVILLCSQTCPASHVCLCSYKMSMVRYASLEGLSEAKWPLLSWLRLHANTSDTAGACLNMKAGWPNEGLVFDRSLALPEVWATSML